MTNRNKMSGAYKAIFAFSIVMTVLIFASYSMQYQATHKPNSTGLAFLIWCYLTFLIYKQRITQLISLYKTLLWISFIALLVVGGFVATNGDNAVYGFDKTTLVSLLIMLIIYYGLLKFFTQQNENQTSNSSTKNSFLLALEEYESESRDKGLWAQCFAEANGDEAVAKAQYLKNRAATIEVI